jgi:integrase
MRVAGRCATTAVRELFKEVQAAAGIDPPRMLRNLRHTYATLHFGLSSHVRIAQDLLGHARSDVTLDTYTSSVPPPGRPSSAPGRYSTMLGWRAGRRARRREVVARCRPGWCQLARNSERGFEF